MNARLVRADGTRFCIGVVYRPETELESHYFQAVMPVQFDEYIWFDETTAVEPLPVAGLGDRPEAHPFAL